MRARSSSATATLSSQRGAGADCARSRSVRGLAIWSGRRPICLIGDSVGEWPASICLCESSQPGAPDLRFRCVLEVGPKLPLGQADAGHMAVPRVDLIPLESPSTASAEAQATRTCRMGSIGRAAVLGWYAAVGLAAWSDTAMTGKPAAVLAASFVAAATGVLLWAGGRTLERIMLRSLLVGLIGLVAGALACASAPAGSASGAEFLCFGAMSMLFGILAALPPALATTLRAAEPPTRRVA